MHCMVAFNIRSTHCMCLTDIKMVVSRWLAKICDCVTLKTVNVVEQQWLHREEIVVNEWVKHRTFTHKMFTM